MEQKIETEQKDVNCGNGRLHVWSRSLDRSMPKSHWRGYLDYFVGRFRNVANIIGPTRTRNKMLLINGVVEQQFRHLFEQPLIGMAFEDMNGKLLQVNSKLCAMLGYTQSEMLTMSCDKFANPEDSADDWALFQELRSGLRDDYHIEKAYLRKDGAKIWGRLRVCRLKPSGNELPMVLAMVEDITDRKKAEQELNAAQSALRELPARLIQAQEEERHRLARELHDDIGQRLSMLMVEMEHINRELPVISGGLIGGLRGALQEIDELITDVHQLSHQLHSSKLQYLGLKSALTELCEQITTQHGIEVDQQLEEVPGLSPEVQLCLYRVAQEALSNVAKHSNSSHAVLRLTATDDIAKLAVEDNGVGFDPAASAAGLGLASMRERLRSIRGELQIISKPGEGTRLVAIARSEEETKVA